MNKKRIIVNLISSLFLQIITIISGFVIPHIILSKFGSEVNGLISSLTQFLNYIVLIEGGVNGVIMAKLYKPLLDGDSKKVSSIVKTSSLFFKRIAIVFTVYTLVLAAIYPFAFRISFSWTYVFTLTIILSIKLFTQYCFSLAFKNLLNADKRVYVVSFVQAALMILEIISAIIIVHIFPDIHILKLVSAAVFIAQPILYSKYVKKHYKIDKKTEIDKELLRDRWNGLAINIAYFIHSNTDITIISVFRGLKEASIYSVYSLVATGLKTLTQSLWKAIAPSIGKVYAAGDVKELEKQFDVFETVTFLITFFLFSIAGLLVTPFVQIYTSGITDADYYQPIFGVIMLLAEAIYILREPYVNLAYVANSFKDIKKHAIIEAFLNIIISLSLVSSMGLIGIAIGTLVAMIYRTLFQVFYLKNHIIKRSPFVFFKKLCIFTFPTFGMAILCQTVIPIRNNDVIVWVMHALMYSIIFAAVYALICVVFFRKDIKIIRNYIKHK